MRWNINCNDDSPLTSHATSKQQLLHAMLALTLGSAQA